MELDEMREKWAEYDRKLEESLLLNRHLLRLTNRNSARMTLQPLLRRHVVSLALEVFVQGVILIVLGNFIYEHRSEVKFVLPALALDLFGIGYLHSTIRQIIIACQIDYSKPITTLQRQLEELRIWRIRQTQMTFLLSPLLWTPLLIVGLKGFLHLDAYRAFGGVYLFLNLLVGLIFIPLVLAIAKRYGERIQRFRLLKWLMQDLAGHSLSAATGFLATLSDFEDEPGSTTD